jgi:hypothetical protein
MTLRNGMQELQKETAPMSQPELTIPSCPECERSRQTRCPICRTAGSDFDTADLEFSGTVDVHQLSAPDEETGDEETGDVDAIPVAPMLMCGTCDEPFEPNYARLCEWCGHDYGDGFEMPVEIREDISPRVIMVAMGMAALLLGIAVYFAMIVR